MSDFMLTIWLTGLTFRLISQVNTESQISPHWDFDTISIFGDLKESRCWSGKLS